MKFRSPVYHVTAVPVEKIEPNTYNPNAVAPPELKLLYDSIKQDGYTMPVVCYYDKERDKYILVDGFHRYRIMLGRTECCQSASSTSPWTTGWPAPSATIEPVVPTTWI